ncbi:MAG: hypothetical protein U1E51_25150 [Candidatus Binatia bacterium]|nr:hypothetical protein [Candidatus Binatia bacterium]
MADENAAPPVGGTPPAAFDWNTGVTDEGVRGWVTSKGFKDVTALATSALNQEKLLGVPADQIVRLPKDDTPEAWAPVYDRLGRPKAPADYGLPVPEGDKGEFAATAAKWFHDAGLSARQARVVAEKWNEHVTGETKAQRDAMTARETEEGAALKTAWGANFDANAKLVDKAAATFGMTPEQLIALKTVMGPSAAMKFVHAIGSKLGVEGEFVIGEGRPGATANTPEGAIAQIAALKNDRAFITRFAAGDGDARAQMKRLHAIAYPGDTQL